MKIWIVRIIGILMVAAGAYFLPKFDQNDPEERYKKIVSIFAIPMGLMVIMATLIQIG
ncbi:hypothetical protein [Anaerofustis stercorihominis]|uniref:hypothetical protein n=1 Tax=Anaerofustis stercorihominis TaxID=214853 RepID=UPI00214CF201|nr:hypothetical protein [Anaerofustis stercorihominis]MCR2033827.1 hypothetical protein [Anaerofustis stercorihominis]